ncbi:MAG: DegT/DnrJ/EryC1/StrS family aminotransferase [Candidatus Omnitrophica bacterium]|nr:DegT/DnrJ/EryC1/StrS family aminotransferase [Candidatus Omnitrophota bacterium]
MNVPFVDFSQQHKIVKEEVDRGLKEVFEKGSFILGPQVKSFEENFAKYCESKYGIGVNSGTDALYLALGALHVGPGDEVILPSFTFIATALCVSYTGAKPVFVDVEDETYNMDSKKLEAAITKKTKVIMPVHLYGQAGNIEEICAIAKKHGITVVEDAAQAHGARYQGKRIGSLGKVSCFSFYPTKGLGGFGDGGMIVTSDDDVNTLARMLRDYGRTGRYDHKIKGFNSRLDTVQAVVLDAKLKYLDEWNAMRNKMGVYYCELLKNVDGVIAPKMKEGRTHTFQTFAVRILKNRDQVVDKLKEKGVSALIHYPIPIHLQEAYKDAGYKRGDLPVSERISDEILSLPMFPHITKEQVEYVCESLKEVVKKI